VIFNNNIKINVSKKVNKKLLFIQKKYNKLMDKKSGKKEEQQHSLLQKSLDFFLHMCN